MTKEDFKHTPGPWDIELDNEGGQGITAPSNGLAFPWQIATVHSYISRGNEYDDGYNASLIAAAPELLESLVWINNAIENNSNLWAAIREVQGAGDWAEAMESAINKATKTT